MTSRTLLTRAAAGAVLAGALAAGALLTASTPPDPASMTPSAAARSLDPPRIARAPGGLGASGDVPAGVTVFQSGFSAVGRLDPDLRAALRRAATEAAGDGVTFEVNSGWRSAAYQERLFRQAVAEHGSEREAARWVATPQTSPHVSGDAVDLGPTKATTWLARHSARFGLCQIYANEPWHFELRPGAADGGCPPKYADPSHDPRMQ